MNHPEGGSVSFSLQRDSVDGDSLQAEEAVADPLQHTLLLVSAAWV